MVAPFLLNDIRLVQFNGTLIGYSLNNVFHSLQAYTILPFPVAFNLPGVLLPSSLTTQELHNQLYLE